MEVTKNIYTIVKLTQFVDHIKKVPKKSREVTNSIISNPNFRLQLMAFLATLFMCKIEYLSQLLLLLFSPTSPQSDQKSEKSAIVHILESYM